MRIVTESLTDLFNDIPESYSESYYETKHNLEALYANLFQLRDVNSKFYQAMKADIRAEINRLLKCKALTKSKQERLDFLIKIDYNDELDKLNHTKFDDDEDIDKKKRDEAIKALNVSAQ